MQRIKVAVLRGGPGVENEVSMKTGKNVMENLSDKYIPMDVFISKDGSWILDGVAIAPEKLFRNIDVVFNAMHGEYGEDGKVQQLMDKFGVKYTGSKALASAIGMNKVLAKEIFIKAGLKTPVYVAIKRGDNIKNVDHTIFKTFPMPAIIKPGGSGSSIGVSLVKSLKDILPAIEKALKYSEVIIVEEFIKGREATCGVVEKFRREVIYPLLPVEITQPKEFEFFGYDAKYSGCSGEVCPGNFSEKEKETLQHMAVEAHRLLGLRHYSRSDFIVSPKRGVYILEVNTLPGLTKESLYPKSLEAVGCPLSYFLDHVITLALEQ
ncbi:MAG: D-alanine--D-alanine ligase [Candidatus Paceibacterota bacterium]|jgi:D-alanine-D-alanine ligase